MGITFDTIGLFNEALSLIRRNDWNGVRILEYGNQRIRKEVEIPFKTGKEYFCNLGAVHVSIDINGKDGSLPLDLSKPITPSQLTASGMVFDLGTNYGTVEHVESNQYWPFCNMHNLVRPGGVMIHAFPKIGHWKGHCKYRYSEKFVLGLSRACCYSVVRCCEIKRDKKKNLIIAVLVRGDGEFIGPKEFSEIKEIA